MTNKKWVATYPPMKGEKIMTNREAYNAVINGEVTDKVIEHFTAELEKLDARNKARSSKPSKTQLENEPIKAHLLEILAVKPMTASEIRNTDPNLSSSKISTLCGQLAKEGKVSIQEIKVPKVGKRNQYSLVTE